MNKQFLIIEELVKAIKLFSQRCHISGLERFEDINVDGKGPFFPSFNCFSFIPLGLKSCI